MEQGKNNRNEKRFLLWIMDEEKSWWKGFASKVISSKLCKNRQVETIRRTHTYYTQTHTHTPTHAHTHPHTHKIRYSQHVRKRINLHTHMHTNISHSSKETYTRIHTHLYIRIRYVRMYTHVRTSTHINVRTLHLSTCRHVHRCFTSYVSPNFSFEVLRWTKFFNIISTDFFSKHPSKHVLSCGQEHIWPVRSSFSKKILKKSK